MKAAAATALVYLGLVSSAVAQTASSEGSIRGFVKDEQGAVLPGVIVTATSTAAPTPVAATADRDGYYRLIGLHPGTYTVVAELQGFSRFERPGVVVRSGLNLGLEIVLRVGNLSETVEVTGETPMLESSSAVQAVNVSGEFQRALPLSPRRQWADFLGMMPGVAQTGAGNPNGGTFYLHGAHFGSQVIQVDGADITAPSQSSVLYIQLSPEALSDTQVKTAGVDASAPLGVGAVISISTGSGTNSLRGAAASNYQGESWTSNNNPGGTTSAIDLLQTDVSIGGPIVRDRVFFFVSHRMVRARTGVSRTAQEIARVQALAPGARLFDNQNDAQFFFGKISTPLSPSHALQGFYQYDRNRSSGGGPTFAAPFASDIIGGHAASIRWSGIWGPSVVSRVTATYSNKSFPGDAYRTDTPSVRVHQAAFMSSGRLQGSGTIATLDNNGLSFLQPHDKVTVSGDLTYSLRSGPGSHELQLGTYLQPVLHIEFGNEYANNGFWLEEVLLRDPSNPAAGVIPFHRQIYDQARVISQNTDGQSYAFYVQDLWRASDRLTLTGGVRVDHLRRRDNIFDAVVQRTTAVGPRVGVNYLLTENGRNTLRGSFGRIHDGPSGAASIRAGTATVTFRDVYDNDLDGVFETELVTPGQTRLTTNQIIDLEGFRQPYAQEWTAGYRRQLPFQIAVDAGVVHRDYRDRTTQIETNSIYEGEVFKGYRNPDLNQIFQITANRFNWVEYDALTLQASQQTARLQVLANYTRQWRRMQGEFQPGDPAAFIQPEAFPNNKGIGPVFTGTGGGDSNALSGSNQSDNRMWRDHIVNFATAYAGPWGVELATTYSFQSGPYSGPVVTRIAAADPRFGPPTVVLSNGRVVANPLATTIRFANPTRGEGQLRLPGMHVWNVRAGRAFRLGRTTLHAYVDLLNAPNNDEYQQFQSGAQQTYGPFYGTGTARQTPRAVQISGRFTF